MATHWEDPGLFSWGGFVILGVKHAMPYGGFWYCIRVSESSIKYLLTPEAPAGRPDCHGKYLAFDMVPNIFGDDWNVGDLRSTGHPTNGLALTAVGTLTLPNIRDTWHPFRIDLVDLELPLRDPQTTVMDPQCLHRYGHNATNIFRVRPHFGVGVRDTEAVAVWDWEQGNCTNVAKETRILSLINGKGITPPFIGHLTENNGARVAGFLVEFVPGCREAGPDDLPLCRAALTRLHEMGIAYGFPVRESFLIVTGHEDNPQLREILLSAGVENPGPVTVLMQNFTGAFETTNKAVFAAEMLALEKSFPEPLLREYPTMLLYMQQLGRLILINEHEQHRLARALEQTALKEQNQLQQNQAGQNRAQPEQSQPEQTQLEQHQPKQDHPEQTQAQDIEEAPNASSQQVPSEQVA